jgi:hypothetical protein
VDDTISISLILRTIDVGGFGAASSQRTGFGDGVRSEFHAASIAHG